MLSEDDWDRLVGKAGDVRRVFDSLPVLACGFDGPDMRFIAANAAFRAMVPRLETLGMTALEFVPELEGQSFLEHFRRVYDTGEPMMAVEWRLHVDMTGSGDMHEHFFDVTLTPRRDADGTIVGVTCLVENATERVQARRAAEARAEQMTDLYEQVRSSATVMQQALLASSVPVIPGVDLAAEYLVATEDTGCGGDWFDAIAVGNRLVLVVGDVVGHGVESAAVMAQLRTALRMKITEQPSIESALEAVNRFSAHVPGSKSATLCVGILDVGTGELRYCTAGHPPPLLVSADATPRFLEPSGAGPLGSGAAFAVRTVHLAVGDAVLFYTDGLIERPGRGLAESTTEFAELAATILRGGSFPLDAARAVDRLCAQTLELLLRTTGYSDDVTLLAAQRTTPPPPLHMDVEADAHAPRKVRECLREWLPAVGAEDSDIMLLQHAIGEYVTNSVEHAYGGKGGPITFTADVGPDGLLHASVVDRGRWKTPDLNDRTRGRGLVLANAFATTTHVNGTPHGTTAELTHQLSRQARIVTDPAVLPAPRQRPGVNEFAVLADEAGVSVVSGDLDGVSASSLAAHIADKTRAGTVALTLNLNEVTHLGSAAVSVLAGATELAREHGTEVTLIAAPGTTAHQVLTTVGMAVVTGSGSAVLH